MSIFSKVEFTLVQIENGIIKHANVNVKKIMWKRYSWNPSTCICENKK